MSIWVVGEFRLTEIGDYRLTLFGDFHLTLTIGNEMVRFSGIFSKVAMVAPLQKTSAEDKK